MESSELPGKRVDHQFAPDLLKAHDLVYCPESVCIRNVNSFQLYGSG